MISLIVIVCFLFQCVSFCLVLVCVRWFVYVRLCVYMIRLSQNICIVVNDITDCNACLFSV